MKKIFLFVLFCLLTTAVYGEEPFNNLKFDEAVALAQKEQKLIIIDFFTTWCGPCKKMDKETWSTLIVKEWLQKNAIALKIDAEQEKELANRFDISAYPTIMILKSDGKEFDRLVGFQDSQTLLDNINDLLTGKDTLSKAKAALDGEGATDPHAHIYYGDALRNKGRYDEALTEYLLAFDNGRGNAAFYGVRLSFLLSRIKGLSIKASNAIPALYERRDKNEALLNNLEASRDDLADYLALNRELQEESRSLKLFNRLKTEKNFPQELKVQFVRTLLPNLVVAKNYQDVINYSDRIIDGARGEIADIKHEPFSNDERSKEIKKIIINNFRDRFSNYYEALLGINNLDTGQSLSALMIEFDNTSLTYTALVEHAARAGHPNIAKKLIEEGLKSLPEGEKEGLKSVASKLNP